MRSRICAKASQPEPNDHIMQIKLTRSDLMEHGKDSDDYRWCEACKKHIDIKNGGEANWTKHEASKAHKANVPTLAIRKITNFFTTKPPPMDVSAPPSIQKSISSGTKDTTVSGTSRERSIVTPEEVTDLTVEEPADDSESGADMVELATKATQKKFKRLTRLSELLPSSIPVATEADLLAALSKDPSIGVAVQEGQPAYDVFEDKLNKVLHSVFQGKTTAELSMLIRRGSLGLNAFQKWVEICVQKLYLPITLFDAHIERLVDASSLQ